MKLLHIAWESAESREYREVAKDTLAETPRRADGKVETERTFDPYARD